MSAVCVNAIVQKSQRKTLQVRRAGVVCLANRLAAVEKGGLKDSKWKTELNERFVQGGSTEVSALHNLLGLRDILEQRQAYRR